MTKQQEYCIPIYPKGRKQERYPSLYFDSKEEKEEYIVKEGQFCMEAQNNYFSANSTTRESYQEDYDLKRVNFAKQQNYAPKKGNGQMWIYTEPIIDDEPKRFA